MLGTPTDDLTEDVEVDEVERWGGVDGVLVSGVAEEHIVIELVEAGIRLETLLSTAVEEMGVETVLLPMSDS